MILFAGLKAEFSDGTSVRKADALNDCHCDPLAFASDVDPSMYAL